MEDEQRIASKRSAQVYESCNFPSVFRWFLGTEKLQHALNDRVLNILLSRRSLLRVASNCMRWSLGSLPFQQGRLLLIAAVAFGRLM